MLGRCDQYRLAYDDPAVAGDTDFLRSAIRRSNGNQAVQQAIAGANHYHCDVPAVVTQSHFTDPAKTQARKGKVRVILVDRWRLKSLGKVLERAVARGPASAEDAEIAAEDAEPTTATPKTTSGYCIGCREPLPWNPHKPFCSACWKRSDAGKQLQRLPKRVCHTCGKEHAGTWSKPQCYACWQVVRR